MSCYGTLCFAKHSWPHGNHDVSQTTDSLVMDFWLQLLTRKVEGVLIRRTIARRWNLANYYNSQERQFSSVKWYLYIYFWTTHFHLIISTISMVSRRKSLYFIDSFRDGKRAWLSTNKYATIHVPFPLKKAITVARTADLPLASYVVLIFLGFVIQSLTSP